MLNRGAQSSVLKCLDWELAKKILKEKKPLWAEAGLREDMSHTAGIIWEDNSFIEENDVWESSTWATPILILYYDEEKKNKEIIECYYEKDMKKD